MIFSFVIHYGKLSPWLVSVLGLDRCFHSDSLLYLVFSLYSYWPFVFHPSVYVTLKGEPLQSPGLRGLTNLYLLIYSKRCSRQGTREPARGWTLFQSKNTDWLWTSRSLGTPFVFATTSLCLISLVTMLVDKCLLSTMRCHVRREVL